MRLVLCDDNRILCEALASIFQARGHQVLAITTSAEEGIAAVSAHHPDVCLLDVLLPESSGLDAAGAMRRCYPDTKVVLLSCLTDSEAVSEAKKIGAAGFLRKDQKPDAIVDALSVVAAGGVAFEMKVPPRRRQTIAQSHENPLTALSPREREVLRRIVEGQNTRQMAGEMNVAVSTLRSYIKSVLAKLGAHSRIQAAAIATACKDSSVT
jgi:two-component system, NarL family, nitrate/nitrite response regulator NarL